jgi:hypothetical protein
VKDVSAKHAFLLIVISWRGLLSEWAAAAAPAGETHWIEDNHGCRIANPNPRPQVGESVRWNGNCKKGYADGYELVEWFDSTGAADGWMKGDFTHGYLQGAGEFQTAKGTFYRGTIRNSLAHGHGTLVFSDGTRYTGEFVQGHFNGHGTTDWPNGTRYEGEYEHDKRSGYGVVSVRSGTRFEGRFKNDEADGPGTIVWSDGTRLDVELQRIPCDETASTLPHIDGSIDCYQSSAYACKANRLVLRVLRNQTTQNPANVRSHPLSEFMTTAAKALAPVDISACRG